MPLCAVGVGDVVELDEADAGEFVGVDDGVEGGLGGGAGGEGEGLGGVGGGIVVLSDEEDLGAGEAEEGDAGLGDEAGVEGTEGDVVGELVVGGATDLLDGAERGVLGDDADGAARGGGDRASDDGLGGEDGGGKEKCGEGEEWAHGGLLCGQDTPGAGWVGRGIVYFETGMSCSSIFLYCL